MASRVFIFLLMTLFVLAMNACQSGNKFSKKKYTNLHKIAVVPNDGNSSLCVEESQGMKLIFPSDPKRDSTNYKIVSEHLALGYQIMLICEDDSLLVMDPKCDSLTNRLYGVFQRDFDSDKMNLLILNLAECPEPNDHSIDLAAIESFGILEIKSRDLIPNLSFLTSTLDNNQPLYVSYKNQGYLVANANLDSLSENICGTISPVESIPDSVMVLHLSKSGIKDIPSGCFSLENTVEFKKSERQKDEYYSEDDKRGLNVGAVIFFVMSLSAASWVAIAKYAVKNKAIQNLLYVLFVPILVLV